MSLAANPLLQQFIPEARDLLELAGRSLLALERSPDDAEPMNALFRAVHTLKGTSGLFEIGPLTRVVHAAEDLLSEVQSGRCGLTGSTADLLLTALDQVSLWIDALDKAGDLPEAASASSDSWVERLRASFAASGGAVAAVAGTGAMAAEVTLPDWVAALSSAEREACTVPAAVGEEGATLLAVSYAPDEHCFFRGEDPLALMRQIGSLRLLRAEPAEPWPPLDDIDPFRCNLRLHAIAAAPAAELEHLFRYVRDQVEIVSLPGNWPAAIRDGVMAPLPPEDEKTLRTLLAAQRRLLEARGPQELWPGRLEAAARALRGVLRHVSRDDLLPDLEAARDRALTAGPAPLLEMLGALVVPHRPTAQAEGRAEVQAAAAEARSAAPPAATTLRVEQGKIDALMNLIGELVVAKNALAYLARRADEGSLGVRELAREIKDRQALVNRIAEDMQAAVMAVRMLPVDHVFQRFPRLVRDIARRLGKQVELVVEGGETEADKNVIEVLADPLIHMVRNSLDHGIELPEERLAGGKLAHGTIRLQALQDNDSVVIRISDDGRGIDAEVVRRKAVEKGLLDAERAAALSEEETAMLIFAPGLSTAAAVSDLSGRGVGMDVVRSAIEKAGGRVTLSSRRGEGTTVELTLPLSMAVTRIMTVACGERLFGVPMGVVVETVRVPRTALHCFRDREALVLRDSVVPVVRLARLLDLPEAEEGSEEAILVVRLNGERLGIVVGAFREGMEVIVKPMEGVLAGLRGFAGTTLLGDGRVLLILDLRELVA
ncbi:chemotaxis protein CheA [Roseicella aquatilis]|uniref:Chemotaxis protein CheA n=1 Tax=Roseicella aquatilis TaxID=2527868 RepID=A0A4R4DRT1_9PROT|nr:chemotaxis protein CheA [Roseicella aquatilis]TCZ64999.1 chemotaxis protein CheA [Roseicella aquatilis]